MATQHGILFYVVAPLSTIDMENKSEVTGIGDKKITPDDVNVINPAFDMTHRN